jgi:hypothetical protein
MAEGSYFSILPHGILPVVDANTKNLDSRPIDFTSIK